MMSVGLLIPMASEKAYLDKAISRYSPEVAATARAGLKNRVGRNAFVRTGATRPPATCEELKLKMKRWWTRTAPVGTHCSAGCDC
jgi:hypothetical protein